MKRKILQVMTLVLWVTAVPAFAKGKKAKPDAAVPSRADLKHVPPDRGHTQPDAKPAAQPEKRPTVTPQKFVDSLYERLNVLAKGAPNLDVLHAKIGDELKGIVDYPEMAKLALGQKWLEIDEAQKAEFIGYLMRMVQNTYVKRFKPGQAIDIQYGSAPRELPDGRVEVPTTITVGKTSAEVHYKLLPAQGRWWVFDIVVDEASQVQTYRSNFKKILDKEGWPGLMTRMKKAAEKKV
jgi:phospholipid transport system substrate-binding protein